MDPSIFPTSFSLQMAVLEMLTSVCFEMFKQGTGPRKSLLAHVAFEGTLSSVLACVLSEVGLSQESLLADSAFKLTLLRVHHLVLPQASS